MARRRPRASPGPPSGSTRPRAQDRPPDRDGLQPPSARLVDDRPTGDGDALAELVGYREVLRGPSLGSLLGERLNLSGGTPREHLPACGSGGRGLRRRTEAPGHLLERLQRDRGMLHHKPRKTHSVSPISFTSVFAVTVAVRGPPSEQRDLPEEVTGAEHGFFLPPIVTSAFPSRSRTDRRPARPRARSRFRQRAGSRGRPARSSAGRGWSSRRTTAPWREAAHELLRRRQRTSPLQHPMEPERPLGRILALDPGVSPPASPPNRWPGRSSGRPRSRPPRSPP